MYLFSSPHPPPPSPPPPPLPRSPFFRRPQKTKECSSSIFDRSRSSRSWLARISSFSFDYLVLLFRLFCCSFVELVNVPPPFFFFPFHYSPLRYQCISSPYSECLAVCISFPLCGFRQLSAENRRLRSSRHLFLPPPGRGSSKYSRVHDGGMSAGTYNK